MVKGYFFIFFAFVVYIEKPTAPYLRTTVGKVRTTGGSDNTTRRTLKSCVTFLVYVFGELCLVRDLSLRFLPLCLSPPHEAHMCAR